MVEVRAATAGDDGAVLELLQASMGWVPDEQHRDFFEWKHRRNPFGASPAWVATEDGQVVGFRTFLRWRFLRDGEPVEAVRAVDTATHPDFQGRGIFTQLTRQALEGLAEQGIAFVFNTPNERSRPGYLKMGWELVRRLPVATRPRSPLALFRLARARTPADKWSTSTAFGSPAAEVLADGDAVGTLLGRVSVGGGASGGLWTERSVEYLRWRYGFEPLRYRVVTAPGGVEDGLLVFRLRQRGAATEAAVCETLVPGDDLGVIRRLLSEVVGRSGADHAVVLGPARPTLGLLPVPGQGPTLLWRSVLDPGPAPSPDRWHLSLGDIELM